MREEITITENEYDIQKCFAVEGISKEMQDIIEKKEIVLLPTKYSDEQYYYAQETIDFLKFCREQEPSHSFGLITEKDIKIRSLHSFDIWAPVLWVAEHVLLPIAISVISKYIADKLKGRENESAQADVNILVGKGKKRKEIHYKGNAKEFEHVLGKIDINKL